MGGETGAVESGWTTDTLKVFLQQQIHDLAAHVQWQHNDQQGMLLERYATQTKALDKAFVAQETATTTAFAAADKAVQAALLSAEKAVVKAENAADKRFEGVNELRGQLSDVIATLISRVEVVALIGGLTEKLDADVSRSTERAAALDARLNSLELRLTSRLDQDQGRTTGVTEKTNTQRMDAGLTVSVLTLLLFLVSIAVSVGAMVLATRH